MEETFPQIRHVILDEVQNFQAEDGDWLRKARALVKQHIIKCEFSHCDFASDTESFLESESETEQDNSDTNCVAALDPECSICQSDGPGYLWCFMDKSQRIYKSKTGIPKHLRQTFMLKKVIRTSKQIFNHAEQYIDGRIWPPQESLKKQLFGQDSVIMSFAKNDDHVRRAKLVTIGHDFDGEQSEIKCSKGERIACLIGILESLLKEGYSKGDIAVLCFSKPLEGHELEQLQEFSLTVNAERNDDDNIVLSTVTEYAGLERPVVVIVRESFNYKSKDVLLNRLNYCAFTRGMVKLITLSPEKESRGQKRKESN